MGGRPTTNRYTRALPNPEALTNDTFWEELATNMPAHFQIIEGGLYLFELSTSILYQNENTFPHRCILTTDQRLLTGNVIRFLGKVPDKFIEKLPNTATLIGSGTISKIRDNEGYECERIGCYDRYHCFWYHQDKMETKGPWNKIPSWHKPGWENCPLFINKFKPF